MVPSIVRAVADELGAAIDDDLRSVDAAIGEGVGVPLLTAREIGRGKGVSPAEMIPVVHVFFQGENFDAIERLVLAKLFEQGIRGRATGAAFGGEEFEDDGLLFGGVGGGGGVRRPANGNGHNREDRGRKREGEEEFGAHGFF